MYEVEVKVPAALERVRDRLSALQADRGRAVVQVDTYYDAPHRSFPDTDEALRIRRERTRGESGDSDGGIDDGRTGDEGASTRVTYKGPLVDDRSKTRTEVETAVADGDEMDAILDHLGFDPAATVRKERERYAVEGCEVTLDAVDGVGEFVEVETAVDATDEGAADEIERARRRVFDVLERLDLDPADGIRTSYLELLAETRGDPASPDDGDDPEADA